MSRIFYRLLFHSAALIHHSYVAWVSLSLAAVKHHDPLINVALQYGTRFLTYWNLSFQLVFLAISLRCDLAELQGEKIHENWTQLRERIFHGLVFPFTLYVVSTFWTLYCLDREFVYPRVFDTFLPWWLNHSIHTVILPVLMLEMCLQPRPTSLPGPYGLFVSTLHLYSVVYHVTYFMNGVWLYPFYYMLSWPYIVLWHFKFVACLHILYYIQWPLFRFLHHNHFTVTFKASDFSESIKVQ